MSGTIRDELEMDLLRTITSILSPRVVYRASLLLDEHERETWMAIEQFIPTVLAAAINYVDDHERACDFLAMLETGRHDGKLLGELESLLTNRISAFATLGIGERACAKLIGEHVPEVVLAVADDTKIGKEAARELLNLTMLVMLELIGRERKARRLISFDPLMLLTSQRRAVARVLPAEVGRWVELYATPNDAEVEQEQGWNGWKFRLSRLLSF